jgi:hypothetical protein
MTALRALLFVHAIITFAAGVSLVAAPGAIPSVIGIHLGPIWYLLAGAEFSVAFISFYGVRCRETESIRLIVLSTLVFHASIAALEVLAIAQGIDGTLWGNVALRLVVIGLFAYRGIFKQHRRQV